MLGRRIAEAREARNLSRQGLAERLDVSYSAISRWERGERRPSADDLPRLATTLGVTVGWLLGTDEGMDKMSPSGQESDAECRITETDPITDILETVKVLRAYPEMDYLVHQLAGCKDPVTVRKIVRVVMTLLEEELRQ